MANLLRYISSVSPGTVGASVMVLLCVACAALAAGLTIGLVSIDKNELSLILINGTAEEKRQARAILPIIKDHHWLLVTLFLFNATANEALPLFLGDLMPRFASVIVATFTVLIFGEIIPSSIFSGPSQMELAASLSGVVYVLLGIFYPVARPIALFLDHWLGKHESMRAKQAPFNAKDLYTLLSLARREGSAPEGDTASDYGSTGRFSRTSSRVNSRTNSRRNSFRGEDDIEGADPAAVDDSEYAALIEHMAPPLLASADENDENLLEHDVVTIAQGAIVCSKIFVEEIVHKNFFTLDSDRVVNINFFEEIGRSGLSRIPIKKGDLILGYIVAKELLAELSYYLYGEAQSDSNAVPVQHKLFVHNLPIHAVEYCLPNLTVLNALNRLQTGDRRIGVVTSDGTAYGVVMGFFTLEDIMEEIIQEEIDDEKDRNPKSKANRISAFYGNFATNTENTDIEEGTV